MAPILQQLRTTDPTKIPSGLEPGQVAFNLANRWMFVGVGGNDILVNGAALTGYGGAAQTILGVASIAMPAQPTGKGYQIFRLEDAPPPPDAQILTALDTAVGPAAGASPDAKIKSWLAANQATVTPNPGDIFIISDGGSGPQANAPIGAFVWNGTSWAQLSSSPPAATARQGTANTGTGGTQGVVYLARDTDVLAPGATGATVPDPTAVATAAQLKLTNDQLATVLGGTALLGTYDASATGGGSIETPGPEAGTAGRAGLVAGAKLTAGSGLKAGDYFIIGAAGTMTDGGLTAQAVNAGDTLMYSGSAWTLLPTGPSLGGAALHGLTDVNDATGQTVTPANQLGLLVRDGSIAEGLAGAWKMVGVIDGGTW